MLYLIKKDLKELFSNKKRILVSVLVLIILIISTSLYMKNSSKVSLKELRLGVINEDSSSYSRLLLEYFKTSESFSAFISVHEGNKRLIEEEFHKGDLDAFLLIPQGFADNLRLLNHLPIEVVLIGEDKNKAILIDNILKSYEKYIKAVEINCVALYDKMSAAGFHTKIINEKNIEISLDLIFTALGKENFFLYEAVGDYKNSSVIHYLIVALLCTLTLYIILYMGLFLRKEKDLGLYGRLYAAGLSVWTYVLEKTILFLGIIALPTFLITIVANIFFDLSISFLSLVCYLALVITGVTFVILSSVLFKKTSDYLLIGNFICLFFTIFGGGVIPIMFLPDKILKVAHFTPTYWMIKLLLLSEFNTNSYIIYKSILFLFISALVFYFLSLFVYKKEAITHV